MRVLCRVCVFVCVRARLCKCAWLAVCVCVRMYMCVYVFVWHLRTYMYSVVKSVAPDQVLVAFGGDVCGVAAAAQLGEAGAETRPDSFTPGDTVLCCAFLSGQGEVVRTRPYV